jgi:hypothetical protein
MLIRTVFSIKNEQQLVYIIKEYALRMEFWL